MSAAANGAVSPYSSRFTAHGDRQLGARPAELALERHHEGARRRAEPGGADEGQERDRGDDPTGVDHARAARSVMAMH